MMARDLLAMEDEYFGRLHDRWDEAHEPEEREKPDYNVPQRLHAIEDVLNSVMDTIDLMEKFQNGNREQRAYAQNMGEMLETMRKYRNIVQEDYDDTFQYYESEF